MPDNAPSDNQIRHRLIPTQGRKRARYVRGLTAALQEAAEWFADSDIPVLVCEAPEGGLVRRVRVVGQVETKTRKVTRG